MATYAVQGDARGSPALRPALRDTERSPGSCSTTGTMSPRQCKESSFSLAPLRGIAPAEPRSRGSRSRPKTVPRAEAITHRPPRSFPRGARTAASSENPSAGFFLSTSLAHAALHGSAGAMAPGAVWYRLRRKSCCSAKMECRLQQRSAAIRDPGMSGLCLLARERPV